MPKKHFFEKFQNLCKFDLFHGMVVIGIGFLCISIVGDGADVGRTLRVRWAGVGRAL